MASELKWIAPTNRASGISADTVAAGSNEIGNEIDNQANLDRFAAAELTWICSVASTAGEVMELYVLYALDGTNYEDGDNSVEPQKAFDFAFAVRNLAASPQRVTVRDIQIAPHKFKILLKNDTTIAATASSVQLHQRPYNL